MTLTRSGPITNRSGEHARHLYNVGKKLVDQVARANSGRVVASEVAVIGAEMSIAEPDGEISCFTFGGFALGFDTADLFGSGAAEFLIDLGLTRDASGVVSLSELLSTRTYWN